MEGEDRISELPVGILDNILGYLPIQEAARTAILSSFWKDIWFSLTKLNFGDGFFDYICLKYSNAEGWKSESQSPILEVVNKILTRHTGPIQKIVINFSEQVFAFHFSEEEFDPWDIANLLSDYLNQWLLLLTQNGVEEIDISCFTDTRCRVPNYLFSCPTLKRLKLDNISVELINASCVLPNVTSLCLDNVDFKPRTCPDYVVYLPMLEDLSFEECEKIFDFDIVAPKLGSLRISLPECCYYYKTFGVLPPNLDLSSISSFDLSCSPCCFKIFIEELTRVGQAPALNFELLKLCVSSYSFVPENVNNSAFIHLLRVCPKLCELDIRHLESLKLNPEDFVLMEELSTVARTLKMLHTLKFSHFNGSGSEMLSIEVFLACFPGIEKVVIGQGFCSDEDFKIMQEPLRSACASTNAEIFFIQES